MWSRGSNGRWTPESVPLGEGMVNFPAYLRQLLARGPLPPATVHFEYAPLEMSGGGGAERRRQTVDGMRRDLTRFRTLLGRGGRRPAPAPKAGS